MVFRLIYLTQIFLLTTNSFHSIIPLHYPSKMYTNSAFSIESFLRILKRSLLWGEMFLKGIYTLIFKLDQDFKSKGIFRHFKAYLGTALAVFLVILYFWTYSHKAWNKQNSDTEIFSQNPLCKAKETHGCSAFLFLGVSEKLKHKPPIDTRIPGKSLMTTHKKN